MRKQYRDPKRLGKVDVRGNRTFQMEDGQVALNRFTTKERKAIVKARRKAKKLHGGTFWDEYCTGYFPRKDNCHRNAQIMTMYSGLELSYNEGWTLYRYKHGDVGFCYHAWNEYDDGRILDTTWDFEYYPISHITLGTAQDAPRLLREHYDGGSPDLFNRAPPTDAQERFEKINKFLQYHADNFIFSQDLERSMNEIAESVLKVFVENEVFHDLGMTDAMRTASGIVDSTRAHLLHTYQYRADAMGTLIQRGFIQVSVSDDASPILKNAVDALMSVGTAYKVDNEKSLGGVANMI